MEGYIDQGKIPVAGFLNADPPGEPQFALTAAGSSYANTIQQAGGEVTVDNLGGVGLLASSGSQLGIDSFANIFLRTASTGTILLETTGSGDDVDIINAGTIVFDSLGQGSLYNVQSINGSVYPPTGSGATTSITQANALVACLGSGGVLISSIGSGVDVEVYNAGTIRFDTAGVGAIENLSTVNGVAYPPPSSVSSDLTVSTLTAGSYISTLSLEGISTINGSEYPPPPPVFPDNLSVTSVTASSYVSTANISVSTINDTVYIPNYSGLILVSGDSASTTWISDIGVIPGFTNNAVLQTTLQVPDGTSQNWIVSSQPSSIAGSANIVMEFASPVAYSSTIVAYTVHSLDAVPSEATPL